MTTETLPAAISEFVALMDENRAKALELADAARTAERIAPQARIRVNATYQSPQINVEVPVDTFREVVPLLREFAKAGYRQVREPGDSASTNTRMHFLGRDGQEQIRLDATLTGNGKCRRVQVGTEPVYQLVCE